jgi:hypothetical protein
MIVRIVMGLVMIGMGSFSFYTILAKPHHDWSRSHFDRAIGIPKIVTRVTRGAFGLLFVVLGVITILRAAGLLS